MALSQQINVAREAASVMEKINVAAADEDKPLASSIYTVKQKSALEDARRCIETLLAEYNNLQIDRDVTQQEAYAATEFYELELQQKKDQIASLELKLQKKEEELVTFQKDWQEKSQASVTSAAKEKAEFLNQLNSCQNALSSLETFRAHQIEVEKELEHVKADLSQQQQIEQQHLAQLERKYFEKTNNLKRDYERGLEELESKLETEIEERVGTRIRHILQDNERLIEELQMHVDVTNSLHKDKNNLQLEYSKLVRDLDLLRQAEALHLHRNSNQARTIAENNIKLQKLELNVEQLIKQHAAERRDLETEHERIVANLEAERQTLKRLAQVKIKELKKMRQIIHQMDRERTEVETFLIESLHYVTDQIKNARRMPQKLSFNSRQFRPQSPATSTEEGMLTPSSIPQLPSVRSVSSWPGTCTSTICKTPQDPSKGKFQLSEERNFYILRQLQEVPVKSNPKVDISELTWEEKEKVLRYLFQKINNAHQPNTILSENEEM